MFLNKESNNTLIINLYKNPKLLPILQLHNLLFNHLNNKSLMSNKLLKFNMSNQLLKSLMYNQLIKSLMFNQLNMFNNLYNMFNLNNMYKNQSKLFHMFNHNNHNMLINHNSWIIYQNITINLSIITKLDKVETFNDI